MSPEAQRIAIATACGWTLCQPRASQFSTPWICGLNPNPHEIIEVIPCDESPPRKPNESDYGFETRPDYLGDLNAIHEAVMSRDSDERWAIFATLAQIVPAELPSACGTAAQWSEAFLRTLDLWTDT